MNITLKDLLYLCITLFVLFYITNFLSSTLAPYKMHIYVNNEPLDIGSKEVRKCYSFTPNFNCGYKYPITGVYYIKAITYKENEEMSNSGWQIIP